MKYVLSLKGALALASARGLMACTVGLYFHGRGGPFAGPVAGCGYDQLSHIDIIIDRTGDRVVVSIGKARIDRHVNVGRASTCHPLTLARAWATKIALVETFDFLLESDPGDEWTTPQEQV